MCPWLVSWLVWLPACLEPCIPGSCALLVRILIGSGYLHTLNLVSLVRVSLLVGVLGWFDYLHTLNLVSLVRVARILVGSGYLHTLNLVCLVGVPCWFVS